MNNMKAIVFSFALLSMGVSAQEHQHSMPGMQTPAQGTQQKPNQPQPAAPPGAPGMQTIEQQQQAKPQHEMRMEHMEMRSPETTPSEIRGLQEPENPQQKTGAYLPVPDLLESARKGARMKLETFEQLALQKNPTMRQAELLASQSSALAHQAGLWPNPTVGYSGEEIRGGSSRGGQQGGFIQQNVVLGRKLRLRQSVFEEQRKADEFAIQEQKLNILGAVRVRFYEALAAQRTVEVRGRLLQVASEAAETAHQLANVGQADAPDILQTEVEAEQAKLDFARAQREYIQAFNSLAAVTGQPGLAVTLLEGELENPPEIDIEHWLETAIQQSPGISRASQEAKRAEAMLARDRREAIPDVTLRAGIQQNREISPETMRPIGAQGFATASVQIPLFNRNQGNVEAARLDLERARHEVERIKLSLAEGSQAFLQRYAAEKLEVERYRTQLLPRAQRAYELYLQKYRNMAAAYPGVIISQRTFFQLQENYARALGDLWSSALQLQSYLYADGLSAPRPNGSTSPTNLPNGGSGGNE